MAISYKWTLRRLDISNAFLHGVIEDSVYMQQPKGFVDPHHPDYVCRLHNAVYDLKQASGLVLFAFCISAFYQ